MLGSDEYYSFIAYKYIEYSLPRVKLIYGLWGILKSIESSIWMFSVYRVWVQLFFLRLHALLEAWNVNNHSALAVG